MTFSFTSPPVCYAVGNQSLPTSIAKAIEVGVSFTMGQQSVGLLMRNYQGVGDYHVDPYGNGNYVLYDPIQTPEPRGPASTDSSM